MCDYSLSTSRTISIRFDDEWFLARLHQDVFIFVILIHNIISSQHSIQLFYHVTISVNDYSLIFLV